MNSWQTFLASIRLSLPEISLFQRNINFYLKYPDIRSCSSHALRHNRPIASPRATCAAHCTVATFFSPFFAIAPHAFMGREKNVGRVDDWAIHRGQYLSASRLVTKIGVSKIGSLFARGIFILYTNIISKFKRDFFATRSLESYNTRNTRTLISSIVPDCVTQRCDDIDYKCTRLRIVNIGRSTINTIV